ncbi:MAG TPA: hypothetical protein VM098_02250, partial [Phycisphaerae bacterium]|nr:hypothetical protein [Phycisphaerae bacterium]
VGMLVCLFYDRLWFDVTVLNIWAGRALLRFSRGWRIFVLVQVWAAYAAVGALGGAMLAKQELQFTLFNVDVGPICPVTGWSGVAAALLVVSWAYWVLTNERIRRVFREAAATLGRKLPVAAPPEMQGPQT